VHQLGIRWEAMLKGLESAYCRLLLRLGVVTELSRRVIYKAMRDREVSIGGESRKEQGMY
jgi:hypothetical protein